VGKETHNGGQGPLFIALDAGTPVVFKPVCVRNETLFAAVIDAIAGRLAPLDLRYPACLPAAGDTGLIEWLAKPRDPLDASALRRFHLRLGVLIALAYALNATDLHLENVLAVGEHPVLIDLEMLLYRFPPALGRSDVTFSGLIERRSTAAPTSGVQGGGDVTTIGLWGTPDRVWYRQPQRHTDNRPVDAQGLPLAAEEHAAELLEGFALGYRAITERRRHIEQLVLHVLAQNSMRTRHLVRYTAYYTLHLLWSLQPSAADPAYRLRERLLADESAAEYHHPALIECEVADLVRGDVPYFYTHPDSTDLLHHSGVRVSGFFDRTATDELRATLQRLGPDDQVRQEGLLRDALHHADPA
jgi:lantibiotic modifying enzyme